MALHPPLSAGRLAWRERHRRSTCCCYGKPPLPGCIRLYVLAWSQQVRPYTTIPSYLTDFRLLAWGGRGKRVRHCCYHYLLWPLLMLFRSCPCALHMEDGGAWASTEAWTSLSVPLATVFGPCLDVAAEELAAGRGFVSAIFRQGPLAVAARRDPSQLTSLLYPPCPHSIPLPGNSLTSCFPSLPTRGQAMPGHGPPYTI